MAYTYFIGGGGREAYQIAIDYWFSLEVFCYNIIYYHHHLGLCYTTEYSEQLVWIHTCRYELPDPTHCCHLPACCILQEGHWTSRCWQGHCMTQCEGFPSYHSCCCKSCPRRVFYASRVHTVVSFAFQEMISSWTDLVWIPSWVQGKGKLWFVFLPFAV